MDAKGYGVVIGVVSQTVNSNCPHGDWKCILDEKCDKDGIAVFTKVEAYLPWIKETTGQGYFYAVILKLILNTFFMWMRLKGGYHIFSCPSSSIPTFVTDSITDCFEFNHTYLTYLPA